MNIPLSEMKKLTFSIIFIHLIIVYFHQHLNHSTKNKYTTNYICVLVFLLSYNIFPTIIPNNNIELLISIKCAILTISGNNTLGIIKTTAAHKYIRHTLIMKIILFLLIMFLMGIIAIPNNIPRNI